MWTPWMIAPMILSALGGVLFWAIVVFLVIIGINDWKHRHHVGRHRQR